MRYQPASEKNNITLENNSKKTLMENPMQQRQQEYLPDKVRSIEEVHIFITEPEANVGGEDGNNNSLDKSFNDTENALNGVS